MTYLIRSNPIVKPSATPPIALNGNNDDSGPRIRRLVASETKLAAATLNTPCGIPPSSLPASIIPRLVANVWMRTGQIMKMLATMTIFWGPHRSSRYPELMAPTARKG